MNFITDSYIKQELKVLSGHVTMGNMNDGRIGFSKRLIQALEIKGLSTTQDSVGKLFSVSGIGARKWLKGESMPATKRLEEMAKTLGVSAEWLLTGNESALTGQGQRAGEVERINPLHVIQRLEGRVSPRSRDVLARLEKLALSGKLADDDWKLIESIAERFERANSD